MATNEVKSLNAILKNNDKQALYANSVEDLFPAFGDVLTFVKEYCDKYDTLPPFNVVQGRFPDLEDVEVGAHAGHYLGDLKDEYINNRIEALLTRAGKELTTGNGEDIKNKLQAALSKLDRFSAGSNDLVIMDTEEALRRYKEVADRAAAMGGTPGVPTGIDFIDSAVTIGMQGGDLISIIGYPGRGKSALGALMTANAIKYGYKPLVVSGEMTAEAVQDRVYTILGQGLFSNQDLMMGNVNIDDFRELGQKYEGRLGWVMDGNGGAAITPNVIRAKIDQHHPDFVIIDYLQLFQDNRMTSEMTPRMMNLSLELKALAKSCNIPIIVISSATPPDGGRIDGPPNVERSAWSRQLAYDSTVCVAMHRHDDTDMYECACAKNRYGPLFYGFLEWDMDRGIIVERTDIEEVGADA